MGWQGALIARAKRRTVALFPAPRYEGRSPAGKVLHGYVFLLRCQLALVVTILLWTSCLIAVVYGTVLCLPYYVIRGLRGAAVSPADARRLAEPDAPPAARPRGVRGWLGVGVRATGYVIATPLCILGLAFAGMAVAGFGVLWGIPGEADRQQVETFDLLLRSLENPTTDPYHLLRGEGSLEVVRMRLPHPERNHTYESVTRHETVQHGRYEYEHHLFFRTNPPCTLTTTTPHTRIPPEQLAQARRNLEALYPAPNTHARQPAHDEAQRQLLHTLGRHYFNAWLREQHARQLGPVTIWLADDALAVNSRHGHDSRLTFGNNAPPAHVPKDRHAWQAVEAEEQLWFAWQRLRSGQPHAEADLLRLPELARAAYPDPLDHDAALAWARTLYARHKAIRRGEVMGLLPPTDATTCWLLYQYIGLTDESRRFARDRWLSYFPAAEAQTALAWGRRLEAERRAAGEPLPPSSETVALVCVIERLTGTDAYGERCRALLRTHTGERHLGKDTLITVVLSYPRDDTFFLIAAGDPLRLQLPGWRDVLPMLLILVFVSLALRFVVFVVLGRWVLGLGRNPFFLEFRRLRRLGRRKSFLLSWVVVPLLAWPLAWWTLPVQLRLLIHSPWELLAGVYLSILLGGTIMTFLGRVSSLALIRCGYDLHKTWLDEIIGLSLGTVLLWHFGNDAVSVAAFVACALVPEILIRRGSRDDRAAGNAGVHEQHGPTGSASDIPRRAVEAVTV